MSYPDIHGNSRMRACDKTHRAVAELRDDGDVDIRITYDCEKARQFANDAPRSPSMT
jgi:hypothetical protein